MRLPIIFLLCLATLQQIFGIDEATSLLQKTRVALSKESTWPSDHGDTSRSKVTLNAGLPAGFDAEDLKVVKNFELPLAQWVYTGGEGSKFVYLIGGVPTTGSFVAKLNATTLEVLQKFHLTPALYIGGLLMHTNGHVYCMHSNKLFVFWNGDLSTYKMLQLPSRLNGNLIQTNGMLVTQDGNIVVKQWDLIFEDILLAAAAKPYTLGILYALFAVFTTLLIWRARTAKKVQNSFVYSVLTTLPVSTVLAFVAWGCIIVASFTKMVGPFSPVRYFTASLFYGGGGGELKVIDPITFDIKADMHLTERCSFARMAMSAVTNSEGQAEDAIALLGDENVYQARWNVERQELSLLPSWTREYRRRGDGSFPGTGPSIYNGEIFFTDNTFPVFLAENTYNMFRSDVTTIDGRPIATSDYASLEDTNAEAARIANAGLWSRLTYKPAPFPALQKHKILPKATTPGFMFWSTAVSPTNDNIVVWDTMGRSVQSRHRANLTVNWEISNIAQADCVSIAADKGHIYMSDYNIAPTDVNKWLEEVSAPGGSATKYFIVADVSNGQILANLTIADSEGYQASLVVPGANNDVFIGTKKGLTRIYV